MTQNVAAGAAVSKVGPARPDALAPPDPLAAWLAPVRTLKGVGPRLEGVLARLLGLPPGTAARRLDLLWHLPYTVIDRRVGTGITEACVGGRVTLEVLIERHEPAPEARQRPRAAPRRPYRVRCEGGLRLVFFTARRAHLEAALPEGTRRVVSGPLTRFGRNWQIVHPELILTPSEFAEHGPLQPVYPLTRGLSGRVLGRLIRQALEDLPELPEWQDPDLLERRGWPSFRAALERLHKPVTAADVALEGLARQRLAFDELLASQLTLALVRRSATGQAGRALAGDRRLCQAVLNPLPFSLTSGQENVLAAIRADMARPARMLRLLQGDVGSGKTLVALLAMLGAVEAGAQAVLMAPTEVLARQHQATLARLLAPAGIEPVLLTGRERGAGRAGRLAALDAGRSRIAIGTHALLQEGVGFADLALVVIDEQHRFGVHQRLGLAAKGRSPDLLVMTATPIPRSLVLALYGDMAVSELREKPPGRQAVRTRALALARMDLILAAVARALHAGERLYWVCPQIGDGDPPEDSGQAAAEQRHRALRAEFGAAVGLVHGRMAGAAKDRVMAGFANGEIRLLVATTVIEVGLDVPEATVIVIEQAERFGLAQLHQLRGRVGRGPRPATCLLLYGEPLQPSARARLEVMRATDDGFRIAEEDLRLRGPGEVLGPRQSGLPALRLADLRAHGALLGPARDDARDCLARDPWLGNPRGQALRQLLRVFGRCAATGYLGSG
jgi:ATP-dependent DNA helicase RecG